MRRLLFACISALASQASLLHGMLAAQEKQLFTALASNNLPAVQELIEQGVSVNVPGDHQRTPLHVACDKGNLQIAELLLVKGADVNARTMSERTPLHCACMHGHLQIVELLLKHNADVNAPDWLQEKTPLHHACDKGHLQIAELLLKYNADVNAQDDTKWTPLHWAGKHGYLKVAIFLLSNGAHQLRTSSGNLPSDLAKKPEIKELLKKHMWTEFLKTRNHITNPENTKPPLWDLPAECLDNIWYYMTEPDKPKNNNA